MSVFCPFSSMDKNKRFVIQDHSTLRKCTNEGNIHSYCQDHGRYFGQNYLRSSLILNREGRAKSHQILSPAVVTATKDWTTIQNISEEAEKEPALLLVHVFIITFLVPLNY